MTENEREEIVILLWMNTQRYSDEFFRNMTDEQLLKEREKFFGEANHD